jgi:hypothetical protein
LIAIKFNGEIAADFDAAILLRVADTGRRFVAAEVHDI